MNQKLRTAPLSFGIGAEVIGLDLSQPLDIGTVRSVRQAFLDSGGLLLFRGQELTRDRHIAFSRHFGELDTHETVPLDRHPEFHELLVVASEPIIEGQNNDTAVGQTWHSDMASSLRPAMGSLLRAVTVPPVGGDTMFANMTAAYDALSPGMQRLLEGLHGVYLRERKDLAPDLQARNRELNPPVAQPAVRVHPETGRKALYVSENTRAFEDMTAQESRPLLDFLVRHSTRPQFVHRHRWQRGDLLMWDNRCTMHLALGDYDRSHRRHLERTTVLGEPSGHACRWPA